MITRRLVLCVTLFIAIPSLHAGEWGTWRGSAMDGRADGPLPPAEWSPRKNVAWRFPLPERSGSTPVIVDGQIYLTSTDKGNNILIALSMDGKEAWRRSVGAMRPGKHRKGSGANPSVATDGRHVAAYFRSGDLACFDTSGKLLWQHNIQREYGEDTLWWDLGTSPVMTRDHVVLAVLQSGPSFLVAFDKKTGDQAWKHDRMLNAPEESNHGYTTPILTRENGEDTLIVLAADHATSHDAATGAERWRAGGLNPKKNMNFRCIASPVVAGSVVAVPYARGNSLTGVRLGGRGDVTPSHVLWTSDRAADVPSPASDGKAFYVLEDRGAISRIDPETGKEVWHHKVDLGREHFSASPLLVGNRLNATSESGTTYVYEISETGCTQIGKNSFEEPTVSSPVAVDGKLYLKTHNALYCVSE